MKFSKKKKDIFNSLVCDVGFVIWTGAETNLVESLGYKVPDDFEMQESQFSSSFQVVVHFNNNQVLINHDNIISSYFSTRLLYREFKVKKEVIISKFGGNIPFSPDQTFFFEMGLNDGTVEFLHFDWDKTKISGDAYRKLICWFPLRWFFRKVFELQNLRYKKEKYLELEDVEFLEKTELLGDEMLKNWKMKERMFDIPSDDYDRAPPISRNEHPLQNYRFENDLGCNIILDLDFFGLEEF